MFKVIISAILAACAVFFLACSGNQAKISNKPRLNTSLDLPDFVLKPQISKPQKGETFIYGSGQCGVYENEADADLAITTADNLARHKILQVVATKMASSYDYYAGIEGNTNPETKKAYQNSLSNLSVMELPGIEIEKREYRKGVIYSKARWSKTATNIRTVIENAKALMQKEEALSSIKSAQPLWDKLHEELKNAQ